MKRTLLFLFAFCFLLFILYAIAAFMPFSVNPHMDFQVLYRANRGILQGIELYSQAEQAQMIARDLGVSVDKVFVLPFPYPPWYAVFTLPLAMLPVETAARMWFLLNIAMLFSSVWLMTDGWEPRKRLASFIASFLFLPVFGALIVGQYVFPAILGAALIVFALKRQLIPLLALGMALVTFKPHVGIFILLAALVQLLVLRKDFGRHALGATVLTGMILFLLGFLADKAWPVSYARSLISFKDVSECQLCVSMPMSIAQLIGLGFDQTPLIAITLLTVLVALFIWRRQSYDSDALLAYAMCTALLVNPYLQNYDFAFALVPLLYLGSRAESYLDWLWIVLLFLLPWIGLGLFERAGNLSLLVATLLMTLLILTRLYKKHTMLS